MDVPPTAGLPPGLAIPASNSSTSPTFLRVPPLVGRTSSPDSSPSAGRGKSKERGLIVSFSTSLMFNRRPDDLQFTSTPIYKNAFADGLQPGISISPSFSFTSPGFPSSLTFAPRLTFPITSPFTDKGKGKQAGLFVSPFLFLTRCS